MADRLQLDLELLFGDLPGMTRAGAANSYEALVVCLESSRHRTGAMADIREMHGSIVALRLNWARRIDERTHRAWGNYGNAVEFAAVGLAHLLMPLLTDFVPIERANIGDGIDYWLGLKSDARRTIFQRKGRLEVSGMLRARNRSQILQRVSSKLRQSARSDYTRLPAWILVVDFASLEIYLVKKT